jgi:hypothetical protein
MCVTLSRRLHLQTPPSLHNPVQSGWKFAATTVAWVALPLLAVLLPDLLLPNPNIPRLKAVDYIVRIPMATMVAAQYGMGILLR